MSFMLNLISGLMYLLFGLLPLSMALLSYFYPMYALPVVFTYVLYTKSSRVEFAGGNVWESFSRHFVLWKMMRKHFPLSFHLTKSLEGIDDSRQYIFAIHPHGTCSDYRVIGDGLFYKYFPGLKGKWRTLAASVLFSIPLVREVSLWTSCVDASRKSAEYVLKHNCSILVIPGGEREQLMCEYQKEKIFLKNRFGFVKLAIQYKCPLIPVYVFGTNDLYKTSNFMHGFRLWMVKHLAIALPLFYGENGLPSPFKVPLDAVFGDPIEVPKSDGKGSSGGPSNEQVSEVHTCYIKALTKLFDDNKGKFGFEDRILEIH